MTANGPNRLLIDAEEFKKEVAARMESARDRIFVQIMPCELDEQCAWLFALMRASNAREKVLCVDA